MRSRPSAIFRDPAIPLVSTFGHLCLNRRLPIADLPLAWAGGLSERSRSKRDISLIRRPRVMQLYIGDGVVADLELQLEALGLSMR